MGAQDGLSAFVRGVILFGLPVDLLLLAFYIQRGDAMTGKAVFSYATGVVLFNLTPGLIWIYDESLLPTFFRDVQAILPDPELLAQLKQRWDRVFRRRARWFVLPLLIIAVGNFVYAVPFFRTEGGIFGWTDPYYIAWFVVWGFWAVAFGPYGLSAVTTTVGAIREVARHPLEVDPLHPDRLGGMGSVGRFAIGTTGLLSAVSLFLPMLFLTAAQTDVDVFLWVAGLAMVGSILATFLLPTYITYRKAKRIRDQRLEDLRQQYYALGGGLSSRDAKSQGDRMDTEMLAIVHAEYQDLRDTRVYPLDPTILAELVSSVALPLVFLFIEMTAQGVIEIPGF